MHRAIFTVMYWRGLRASEPRRLPLSAYRAAAGRLYVTRRKGSDSGEYPLSPAEQASAQSLAQSPRAEARAAVSFA